MNMPSDVRPIALDECQVRLVDAERVAAVKEALPPSESVDEIAEGFAVLADPNRVRLLISLLEGGELCVCDLAATTGMGESAVSHALRILRAHRIVKPGQVFNRIHVADIAGTLRAAIAKPATRLYNVSDDEPAPPQEVTAFAAGLMGIAPPPETPFDAADLSPLARSFYEGNRRIANRRIKDELGVTLRYPTYRDGLTALMAQPAPPERLPATGAPVLAERIAAAVLGPSRP